jgi:hypothetical protein
MQKLRLLLLAVLCSFLSFAQNANFAAENTNAPIDLNIPEFSIEGVSEGTIYSNGPYYNVPGSPNRSVLEDLSLGMDTYGFGHALSTGYRVADDWEVTTTTEVGSIQFYAYQTSSGTTSTINHISLAIWDGDPSDPSSSIIWGDQTTNVFTSSEWTGAYRSLESISNDNSRPIMITTVNTPGLVLEPGTYWLDWNAGGTSSSGPWAPPIAILGEATTGNAKQYNPDTSSWTDLLDTTSGTQQGLPFEINEEGETGGGSTGGDCNLDGDTTDGEIWNRPLESGTGMSSVGQGVRYKVYGPFTVDTAGVYTITSTQTGWDGFLFVYQDEFDPLNPLVNHVAGDDDGPGGVGTSQVTPNLSTGTNYFIITTGFDPDDYGPYTTTIDGPGNVTCEGGEEPGEGCFVTGTFDQWPSTTYVPSCLGVPEAITTAGWAGEFSKVQVTAGVEYTFSSSVPTDFITIADETQEIAFITGTGSVTWTSPVDQVIRFYVHKDEDCTIESVSRSRIVQCGEPFVVEPPNYPCYQGDGMASNAFENGYNVMEVSDFRNADDFFVEEGTMFNMQYIRMNIFMNPGATVTNATFNIREDAGGSPSETEIAATFTATPSSHQALGSNFGYTISQVEFVLDTPVELTEGTYWLQPAIATSDAGAAFWEVSTTGTLGSPVHTSELMGPWTADPEGSQAVFFVAGECEELGISDLSAFDFAYYPNPVKDVLNITSKKEVESIAIYNLAGQAVTSDAKASNGQINVSTLQPGTYVFRVTLEGGQVETFKVIKK